MLQSRKRERYLLANMIKDGHNEDNCWKLHPKLRPKKFNNKGKQMTAAKTQ